MVIAACVPSFVGSRRPDAKVSVLEAIQVMDSHSEPGDGLYIVKRDVNEIPRAFPRNLGNLTNLSANHGKGWRWTTLSYPSLPVVRIRARLSDHDRVWLFAVKYYDVAPIVQDFVEVGHRQAAEYHTSSGLTTTLVLMERQP